MDHRPRGDRESPTAAVRVLALRVAATPDLGQEGEHVIRREMPQRNLADWSRRELPLDRLPVAARRQGLHVRRDCAQPGAQERGEWLSGRLDVGASVHAADRLVEERLSILLTREAAFGTLPAFAVRGGSEPVGRPCSAALAGRAPQRSLNFLAGLVRGSFFSRRPETGASNFSIRAETIPRRTFCRSASRSAASSLTRSPQPDIASWDRRRAGMASCASGAAGMRSGRLDRAGAHSRHLRARGRAGRERSGEPHLECRPCRRARHSSAAKLPLSPALAGWM